MLTTREEKAAGAGALLNYVDRSFDLFDCGGFVNDRHRAACP